MKRHPPSSRSLLLLSLVASSLALASSCGRERAQAPPPDESASVPALLAEADSLYAQRESIEHARQAVAVARRARMTDYNSYEAVWKLSKFNYYLGGHEPEERARLEAFREGIVAGEAAVKLAPDRPEGHFWLGANLGGRAKLQGPLYALSSVADIRREMEMVIELDEGFQAGSAYLALGQLDMELPEILGGDRERAVANLERGLRHGENNALLRLRLAEAYYSLKRHREARAHAAAVLKLKPNPDYLTEYKQAQEGARRLLEKLK